jgi:DNA repair protein RadC
MSKPSSAPDPSRRAAEALPTIREWPHGERPREKLMERGVSALSDAEVLAILLRTGAGGRTALDLARELLVEGGSLRSLAGKNPAEFMRVRGIGPAKAVELVAAFELARRSRADGGPTPPVMRTPGDVASLMIPRLRDRDVESFVVLVLDAKNGLKAECELSRGTLNASLVHPREVFKTAIDARAASIIVVHNHPSGNPEPSAEDLEITRQLAETGRILGIPLHDHVIVAGERFTSLAERGAL